MKSFDIDVAIVGLGPAGATVLRYLTSHGQGTLDADKVIAIDRRKIVGSPVSCGELMPSVSAMKRLTPKVPDADKVYSIDKKYQTVQHSKISFIAPNGWKVSTPFDSFSMDRASWAQDRVSSSENAGIRVFRNARAVRFSGNELKIRQGARLSRIRAKVFVAADGVNSMFSKKQENREIVWCRQHVVENLGASYDPSNVLMFFGSQYAPGAYAWIIPKTKEIANVGLGVRRQYLRSNSTPKAILENLWKHPVAKEVLEGSRIVSSVSASVPVGLPLKSTVQNRVLLVGDSASQIISHVGAGIPPALVAGREAAKAIASYLINNEPLQAYDPAWRKKLLSVMKASYKLRQVWDKISATDSRMQWYLKRLNKGDLESVVHVEVPLKLRIGRALIPIANIIIR